MSSKSRPLNAISKVPASLWTSPFSAAECWGWEKRPYFFLFAIKPFGCRHLCSTERKKSSWLEASWFWEVTSKLRESRMEDRNVSLSFRHQNESCQEFEFPWKLMGGWHFESQPSGLNNWDCRLELKEYKNFKEVHDDVKEDVDLDSLFLYLLWSLWH